MEMSPRPPACPTHLPACTGDYVIPECKAPDGLDLSLILPTFNEAQNINDTLRAVCETLRSVEALRFEVIVVDDNSPDGTARLALNAALDLPEVRVICRTTENGLATAVIRGWQAARGDILAVMDADLQHPPAVLTQLLKAIRAGYDLALGSRHVEEGGVSDWNLARRVISRSAQLIGLVILPEVVGRVTDPMSGYFMLRRHVIAGRRLNPIGYKILIEVLARGAVVPVSEVGYVFRERREGHSKVSTTIYVQYLQHLLRLRIALLRQSRFLRFCLVGGSGVLVDMAFLFLLSDPRTLGWGLSRSKILGAEAAIVNNFLWNDAWTFADMVEPKSSPRRKFHRFLKFNAICVIGLTLNVALLNIGFNWFGLDRYTANALAIVLTTSWNYLVSKHLGWRSSS